MNKSRILIGLVISTFLVLSIVAAYGGYSPYSSSSYQAQSSYSEYPEYTQYPDYQTSSNANSMTSNSNYDSSNYGYSYYGPIYEKKTAYDESLYRRRSKTIWSVSATSTERYIGASESMFYDTQNRRYDTNANTQSSNVNYDGGFSWGKVRLFDSSEYARDSYGQRSYYDPMYNSNSGYYNWKY